MILLFGGTSETAPLAEGLAAAGHRVLVSTATDVALDVGAHPAIERRTGALDASATVRLIRERGIRAVVDAAHPYAVLVHEMAQRAAHEAGVPILRFERPSGLAENTGVVLATSHESAARQAASFGRPILLTTGSRHLEPYVSAARAAGVALIARVLPESLETCRAAGIAEDCIVTGRGPFSIEENRRLIRECSIGVLVTKDSGTAGGTPEKIEAARLENCVAIAVVRPPAPSLRACATVDDLLAVADL